MNHLELEFPRNWEFKIIVEQGMEAMEAVRNVLRERRYEADPVPGNISRNRKYITYTVCVFVEKKEIVASLAEDFLKCPGVKLIL